MAGWTASLELPEVRVAAAGVDLTPYCEESWFPREGVLIANKKGSMTKELMTLFMEHVHRNSAAASTGRRYVILLDGHSSRSLTDIRWLDDAKERKQEVVIAPAHTSHFLQPADQQTNRRISYWVTKTKEALMMNGIVGTGNTQSKLICAVEAHKRLSLERGNIIRSFESIALFPMDCRFQKIFGEKHGERTHETTKDNNAPCAQIDRNTDAQIKQELMEIIDGNDESERKLQSAAIFLTRQKTTNSIMQNALRIPHIGSAPRGGAQARTNRRLPDGSVRTSSGAPARYVTYGETIDLLRANLDRHSDEQKRKDEGREERKKRKARDEVEKQARSVERKRKAAGKKHKRDEQDAMRAAKRMALSASKGARIQSAKAAGRTASVGFLSAPTGVEAAAAHNAANTLAALFNS